MPDFLNIEMNDVNGESVAFGKFREQVSLVGAETYDADVPMFEEIDADLPQYF